MQKLNSLEDLTHLRDSTRRKLNIRQATGSTITIGMATCGIAAGARETYNAIVAKLEASQVQVPIERVGCIGMCYNEPLVDIEQAGTGRVTYGKVTPGMVDRIIDEHLLGGKPVQEWVVGRLSIDKLALEARQPEFMNVLVCGGERCGEGASREVLSALKAQVVGSGLKDEVNVGYTDCRGLCSVGPVLFIEPQGILYCGVKPDDAAEIVSETLGKGKIIERLLYQPSAEMGEVPDYTDLPFFSKQIRLALKNCGVVDPNSITDYMAHDGYMGLGKALTSMTPQEVVAEVKESGLRGRGGGGFSTGTKWEFCSRSKSDVKYVICNADEGDPGAFMDRSILEGDPHSVVEGMIIAAYAMGATDGFIYCREEYPLAISRIQRAIAEAREYGLLGSYILGSEFSFDIHLREGAGAFVCGEETSLMASIEGRRGEPRPRPPFPAVSGLWDKPSNINNVKSYAMSPAIIRNGADWFKRIGTEGSTGTAVFALTGKVKNTGLIEVPMGTTLGDIVFDVGGGMSGDKDFKAVQTGGPLGGCLPASSLNTPVDFDSLASAGAVMGSGGMIVVDEDTCMVELAKYFLEFATAESCGKCVPCRIGGQRLLEALTRITEGKGTHKDIEDIKAISQQMMSSSLCGLGQRTPGPVLASLDFFLHEFIEHVEDHKCAAGQCKALTRATCLNACPAGVDVPAYVALVGDGQYAKALEIHRQRNPFASVCGRACPAFCEKSCRRAEIDQPVAIRQIKRFMADEEMAKPWNAGLVVDEQTAAKNGEKKIAVVGAGPAGLTAALRMAQRGYKVTVFEKHPLPGGMLTIAIPEYRLPRETVMAEIKSIEDAGVEIKCNQVLGKDFTVEGLIDNDGFDSVILAIGADKSRKLPVEGGEKQGVIDGMDFLTQAALSSESNKAFGVDPVKPNYEVKGKVVGVVGGGDVAIDVARSALRMGASDVHVIYRRAGEHMPAAHLPEEIEAAHEEGIHFHTLVNPVEVLGNGVVTGVKLQKQTLGEFDESARRKPQPLEGETYDLALDILVPAIGQNPDQAWIEKADIETTRWDTFEVGKCFETTREGVFAAGDAVSGPSTIVQAVAQGNLVAASVDHWLTTGELIKPVYKTERVDVALSYDFNDYAEAQRPEVERVGVAERTDNFKEVEQSYDEQTACAEAKRCLRCDLEWLDLMGLNRPQG